MTSAPRITVAIPTYNRARYLPAAVESVLSQRDQGLPIELIVIDNASSDIALLDCFQQLAVLGVRIYRHERNVGFIENWNRCIDYSSAPWIHLLHDDDMVSDGFYRQALEIIDGESRSGVGMVLFGASVVDEEGRIVRSIAPPTKSGLRRDIALELAVRNFVCNPGVVFRRDLAQRLRGFDSNISPQCADWNFWFRLACEDAVFVSDQRLARYRVHFQSLSGSSVKFSIRAHADVADLHCRRLRPLSPAGRPHGWAAEFGRGLIAHHLKAGAWSAALRAAAETVAIEPTIKNIALTLVKIPQLLVAGIIRRGRPARA